MPSITLKNDKPEEVKDEPDDYDEISPDNLNKLKDTLNFMVKEDI